MTNNYMKRHHLPKFSRHCKYVVRVKITVDETYLLLKEIKQQLIHDAEMYKTMYERYGVKKYQGIAKKCSEVAELCAIGMCKYK